MGTNATFSFKYIYDIIKFFSLIQYNIDIVDIVYAVSCIPAIYTKLKYAVWFILAYVYKILVLNKNYMPI